MKSKLYCRIFGHDFRIIRDEGEYVIRAPSNYCRNCGLSKKELKEEEAEE